MMRFWVRVLPDVALARIADIAAWIAYLRMPEERRYSREYLNEILGRPAKRSDVWRHMRNFTDYLMAKISVGSGTEAQFDWASEQDRENGRILHEDGPLLLGTFHMGASDLLGFHIHNTGRRVSMVRMRVGNSLDIEMLERQFGEFVHLLWVNDERDLIFSLKNALEESNTVAMQCDRIDGAKKGACFDFLGDKRFFRTTIYRGTGIKRLQTRGTRTPNITTVSGINTVGGLIRMIWKRWHGIYMGLENND